MRKLALVPLLIAAPLARADSMQCHVVDVLFTPSDKLQIVGWIEDSAGAYVDTIYITQQAGLYGLGNRPGRFDFNSGPKWPYGRRLALFPIWAHRHGMQFPEVVYQNNDENDLSHPFSQSSQEPHFCRPLADTEQSWDTGTCASTIFTDKGQFGTFATGSPFCTGTGPDGHTPLVFDGGACAVNLDCCSGACDLGACTSTLRYPPRTDIARQAGVDSPSVEMYAQLAPWDAVSAATPAGGTAQDVAWSIPKNLAMGDYVAWIEVAKEFDYNASYNCTPNGNGTWTCTLPGPCGSTTPCANPVIPWNSYGEPYRGQPSVVYKVPFTIGATESIASTSAFVGYSDPEGVDGAVRPPDATITTTTPGSGGSRLALVSDGGAMYRVKIDAHPETSNAPPDTPSALATTSVTSQTVAVAFTAPGAAGATVKGYDIRVRAGDPITDANFDQSMPITGTVTPVAPGGQQTFEIGGLLPQTEYSIGVRAFDICHNTSSIAVLDVHTAQPTVGEVTWCFVATAAYGSPMANDVGVLRTFRDKLLHSTVLGELAVESYYTFGPAVAGVVAESDLLRATARDMLAPIVRFVRGLPL